MATKSLSLTQNVYGSAVFATWLGLDSGDVGEAVNMQDWADRSVQVTGTFGGATCVWEGSNDDTNYATLNDAFGNALSFTTSGLRCVAEAVKTARPRIVGGSGVSVNVYATMIAKGPIARVLNLSREVAV